MSRIKEMRERIKARQGTKEDWRIVAAAKTSRTLTGRKQSEVTKKKRSESHEGKTKPEYVKESISKSLTGKSKSKEHKANLKKTFDKIDHQSGTSNSMYGTGERYILVGTEEVYTWYEIKQIWPKFDLYNNLRRDKPVSRGQHKGLHFRVYKP